MRERHARMLLGGACLASLLAFAACPPKPPINPNPPTCQSACPHAVQVCPTVVESVCEDICGRIGSGYAGKLMDATDCPSVRAADPGAPPAGIGNPPPIGR